MESGKAIAEMENYENDWIERIFVARTRGWLLAFTEGGRAYFLSVLDLPESSRTSRGQSVYALIGAERNDRIVSILPVEDLSEAGKLLLFATTGGVVKRTELSEFAIPRAGGIIAAAVRDGDAILDVIASDGRADIILFTRQGRAIRLHEKDIPAMGRTAQGVKGIGLKGKDRVVGAVPVRRDAALLTVIESGWGKRTPLAEFPIQKRGGLGTIAVPGSEGKGGALVGALEVVESDEVTIVTAAGGAVSLSASKVPEQGRRTRGSKVIRLAAGDRVVEVTRSIGKEGEDDGRERRSGGEEGSGGMEGGGEEDGEEEGGAVEGLSSASKDSNGLDLFGGGE
jgi:DNA gyrase subunit A